MMNSVSEKLRTLSLNLNVLILQLLADKIFQWQHELRQFEQTMPVIKRDNIFYTEHMWAYLHG